MWDLNLFRTSIEKYKFSEFCSFFPPNKNCFSSNLSPAVGTTQNIAFSTLFPWFFFPIKNLNHQLNSSNLCFDPAKMASGTQAYPYFMVGGRNLKRIVTPQKQRLSHSRNNVNSKAFTCLHVPPLGAVTLKLCTKIVFSFVEIKRFALYHHKYFENRQFNCTFEMHFDIKKNI